MSNWTHVAGIMRIDDIRPFHPDKEVNFDDVIGREVNYNDPEDIWADADFHPERYLPMGSEGSLHKHIWINSDINCMAAYTISVFGDLRDHDNADEIINWFREKCDNLAIRNAVITVENESYGSKTYTYTKE